MKLVAIAALIAVCGAAKLDRTYLPPPSAATAGGSFETLQTPLTRTSEQVEFSGPLPTGSYTNNFQGVVVDAAGAGTRASPDGDLSGLGGPRDSYGSENSKVGDAAFRGSIAGFRSTPLSNSGFNGQVSQSSQLSGIGTQNAQTGIGAGQNFGAFENKSERPQAFKDRNSNIISYANDVSIDNYSYGFETDNGIAIGENGVANNGIQAQGGYSYKGDDGQVYKVTYVADEGGYRPQGAHLPTPPPIPKEILESLEQNAKEEAAGLVDDGSYDAQKYNAEGDYMHHNVGNIQYNGAQSLQFAKRPESDATTSNTFINQNSQAFGKPGQFANAAQNIQSNFNGQLNYNGQASQLTSNFGANQNGVTTQKESSQVLSGQQANLSSGESSGQFGQSSGIQNGQTQGAFGNQISHFGAHNSQQVPVAQFGSQSSQLTSHTTQQQSRPQFGQSSQFGFQINGQSGLSQANGQKNQQQTLSESTLGSQTNTPAFSSNSDLNSQQTQFENQGYKPQGSFGPEYLPPFNFNNRPSYNKPQINQVPTVQDSEKNEAGGIVLQKPNQGSVQGSSSSSFGTANQAGYKPQVAQTLNGFQSQPSRPNQFNYNNGQTASNNLATSSQFNGSPVSGLPDKVKPTSIPNIELTTPLEPNEKPASSQSSQFNSQTTPNFGNFGSHLVSHQGQPQTGFQNNDADSRPQGSSQFDSSSPAPTAFPTTLQPNAYEKKTQSQQSFINQNQQNNAYQTTQKPSFSQGPDDSYYYNQPSKPFGTPTRPQGSRFPSTPVFQSNGAEDSQNNQFLNQKEPQLSFNQFPSSIAPVSPTSPSQLTQTQSSYATNYNGITQASISPFPSVSPTTSTQYDSTQYDRFGSKPGALSLPSKPITSFSQIPSNTISQNQNQFSQNSFNNNVPTSGQSTSSKVPSFTQTSPITITQNQYTQNSPNNDQSLDLQNGQTNVTQAQQYNGTLYEYNKPPEVLPASEETDSSSNQNMQTDTSSKPENQQSITQFGSQQASFGQNSFSSQPKQPSLNQNNKPQFGAQTYKPFAKAPSSSSQYGQNTLTTFSQQNQQFSQGQQGGPVTKPNESSFSTTQFGQSTTGFGSKPQFGSQPAKPFSSISSPSKYGQNIQGTQYGVQPVNPLSGVQSTTTQFGQNSQTIFGPTAQNPRPQFNAQQNKPFGNRPSTQFESQALGNTAFPQNSQPAKPFGVSGGQEFQGYPSSKPQFGSQLQIPNQFIQNSQQTSGSSQGSSQPAGETNVDADPESQKPYFGQTQLNQGSVQSSTLFGQQTYQATQVGQPAKPQYGVQAQYGQNQNAGISLFGSASSQAQVGPNSAQASSSAVSQPSAIESYKPFGAISPTSFTSLNKPQFDQSPQTSQGVSTTISPVQFNAKPFGSTGNKPPCCKSISGSAITNLNVGTPSQAFAQTQSQFSGFQTAQNFNAQSLAGKGEQFGGPRQPPSFDAQTGYHY